MTDNLKTEELPALAIKFLYSAIGGIVVSVLKLILRKTLSSDTQADIDLYANLFLILIIGVLFLRKEHIQLLRRIKKWKLWRLLNSFILMLGLYAPWFTACSDSTVGAQSTNTFNGFDTALLYGLFAWLSTEDSSFWGVIYFLAVALGVALLLIYTLLNLRRILTQEDSDRWLSISLVFGFLGMLAGIFAIASIQDYLWGYWLSWLGIISSLIAEYFAKYHKEFY